MDFGAAILNLADFTSIYYVKTGALAASYFLQAFGVAVFAARTVIVESWVVLLFTHNGSNHFAVTFG